MGDLSEKEKKGGMPVLSITPETPEIKITAVYKRPGKKDNIMKNKKRSLLLTALAAAVIAAAPVSVVASAATVTVPDGLKLVKVGNELVKGDLTITMTNNGNYTVKAFEMLQLVIPSDTTWTAGTAITNTDNSKNIYLVTDEFKPFFAAAKTSYTTGDTLKNANTLYLTYDDTNMNLNITASAPAATAVENEDYIRIDNTAYSSGHKGKLDTTYFEADIVSRIASSNPVAAEAGASAARLLSDWASKYARDKSLTADKTAVKVEAANPGDNDTFVFNSANNNALVYGYYVIVTKDNTNGNNNNTPAVNQSILNVPMAENVTIKSSAININKSVESFIDANNRNNGSASAKTGGSGLDTDNDASNDVITANIGDVLEYKVTSHIPAYTSYDFSDSTKLLGITDDDELTEANFSTKIKGKYIYTFRDTTFNQDFIPTDTDATKYGKAVNGLRMKIYKADGTTVDEEYLVKYFGGNKYYLVKNTSSPISDAIGRLWETDYYKNSENKYENFFAVNFDLRKLKELGFDGRNVEFTYHTELMGEAGSSDSTNTAKLTYSNDPFDPNTVSDDTTTDTTTLKTYDVQVNKVFSDGSTTDNYKYVSFRLYSDAGKQHSIMFVSTDATNLGKYVKADSSDATTTDQLFVSKADGKLSLHGLGEGTYYLVEDDNNNLKNNGYNKVNPITIVITAKDADSGDVVDGDNLDLFDGNTTKSGATLDGVALTVSKNDTVSEYGIKFDVLNQKGFTLPITGEYGNWLLAIAGIVLVAVGGTVIVLANRKKKDKTVSDEK